MVIASQGEDANTGKFNGGKTETQRGRLGEDSLVAIIRAIQDSRDK